MPKQGAYVSSKTSPIPHTSDAVYLWMAWKHHQETGTEMSCLLVRSLLICLDHKFIRVLSFPGKLTFAHIWNWHLFFLEFHLVFWHLSAILFNTFKYDSTRKFMFWKILSLQNNKWCQFCSVHQNWKHHQLFSFIQVLLILQVLILSRVYQLHCWLTYQKRLHYPIS